VIPPTSERGADAIVQAGQENQIRVLAPVADEEFDWSYFQKDGFHLNEKGAKVFTSRLASNLLGVLSEWASCRIEAWPTISAEVRAM